MVKALQITSRGNLTATQGITGAGVQYWWLGQASAPGITIEANRAIPWGVPGVFSKLYVRIIANTTSTLSAIIVRKNGVDTALQAIIPAGTTGVFEDTTNEVNIVAGDKINYRHSIGGTGSFQFSVLSVIFDATTNCVTKLVTYPYAINTSNDTRFLPVVCTLSGTSLSEPTAEHTIKVPGIAKNAYLLVPSNARTNPTTFTLRKNRVDTALVLTVGAGATGEFIDTSNQISYSIDDEIDWKITGGLGTQNLSMGCFGLEYETTTSQAFLDAGTLGATSDLTIGPNVTEYYTLAGGLMEGVTNESQAQMKLRTPLTLSNLTVFARANTITDTSTVRLRKNGANANLSVTIGSGATGFITDTTNTDVIGPDDLVCLQVTTGATGTTLTICQMAMWSQVQQVQVPVGASAGRQGRSPLYKTRTRPRDSEKIAAVIVRVRIALEYEVEKLSVQIALRFTIQRPRPIVKYASAILTPIAHILPLPVRPTPPLPTIVKVRLTLPLAYEVTSLRPELKAGCSYEVDKLITAEQQNKLRILAVNFLSSDL